MRLKDRVAIVTGGAEGLGKAYAMGFSREGAKVVIADINLEAAKATAEEVAKNGGEALAIRTDVSKLEDTLEMAKKTVERFGRIDILVNNAAAFSRVMISKGTPFYELDLDEVDKVIAVNFKGVLLCARAVFPHMKAQGGGKIINITSTQVYLGGAAGLRYAHYIGTKAGVIGLTRAFAREIGEFNINVNCLCPGSTSTEDPSNTAILELRKAHADAAQSIKGVQYPEDIVGTAIFLASSDSDRITGQTIIVDSGDVMI